MTKQKKRIYLVSMVLLAVLMIVQILQMRQETPASVLSFYLGEDGAEQKITLWENETGEFFVFLPGFTQFDQVRISLGTTGEVAIGDVKLRDGMNCSAFSVYLLIYCY